LVSRLQRLAVMLMITLMTLTSLLNDSPISLRYEFHSSSFAVFSLQFLYSYLIFCLIPLAIRQFLSIGEAGVS